MLPPDLRRKLSQVNKDRGMPSGPEVPRAMPTARTVGLEDVLPGRVHAHELGELYVCERGVQEFSSVDVEKAALGMETIRRLGRTPQEVLFLDIETCGLANCPLFLIGILYERDGQLRVEQLLARDYSEERNLLAHAADIAAQYTMFVTFNGKTFDIPYMRDRMIYHRMRPGLRQEHYDLLPHARRRWRGVLPNCRLQTLEAHVCGRRRHGDTPGELIPQLYHDFVRTGNAAPLEGVFHHNALDLITMVELLPYVVQSG